MSRDTFALLLALLDKRVPRSAKLITAAMVAYTVSPIDLVPDVVPLLGFVDDIAMVAGGVSLARGLIPPDVFAEHRRAADRRLGTLMKVLVGLGVIGAAWTVFILGLVLR